MARRAMRSGWQSYAFAKEVWGHAPARKFLKMVQFQGRPQDLVRGGKNFFLALRICMSRSDICCARRESMSIAF